jgi:uncharacterized protein YbjT (DUF2867 family)
VENTRILVQAAARAGVRRIVHISITNPSADSPLPYFWGKAANEKSVIESGMSYAILRPTVLFGKEDVLINNIAWILRRFPLFALPGDGSYRLQPVYVDDLSSLAVTVSGENLIWNAVGPENFTFREMVELIGRTIDHCPSCGPAGLACAPGDRPFRAGCGADSGGGGRLDGKPVGLKGSAARPGPAQRLASRAPEHGRDRICLGVEAAFLKGRAA